MEIVFDLAVKYNFVRQSSTLSKPLVFHCVPGAGKSSFIRELLSASPKFVAFTFGEADRPSLSGAFIQKAPWSAESIEGKFLLVDEYTESPVDLNCAYAVFGDPLQTNVAKLLRANFTCNISRRIGRCTAQLLREFGFDIYSNKEDSVQVLDVFEADLLGTIICHEQEVADLLCAHNVEYLRLEQVRGKTFSEVTYITAVNHPADAVAAFQCMTRHSCALRILCPNASYTPA